LFLVPRSRAVGFGMERNSLWHGLGLEFRRLGLGMGLERQILAIVFVIGT